MNRIHFTLGILLLIATSVRAQQNPVVGTWQLNFGETIKLMESGVKEQFNSIDQGAKDRIEDAMSGRTFSFNEDGTAVVNWRSQGNPQVSTGAWQVNGQTLTLTFGSDEQNYQFQLTPGSHLVLMNTTPTGLFPNLYLTWHP